MPTIDLGRVKGDTGVSMRSKGSWTPSTAYVNNSQYIDVVTNGGNSYACKTSHTSGSTFSSDNWNLVAQKGAKGDKGDKGNTPTIQAGTVTSLASTAAPTVTATTSGETTTLNFGIPKGDTSKIETPTFSDTVSTYTTLAAANTAAETASNAIKSKVSIFTTLSNMKKSFSAIVQGLKILATNVGAIRGITSDINSESTAIAASSKMVHDLNSNLSGKADKTVTVDINNSSGVYHGETFPFGVKMLTGFKKSANYNLSRAYGNAFYTDFSIALPTFFNNISCAIVQLYSSAGAYVTVTGWSDREITGYIISPENTAINAALQFIIYGT